MSARFIPSSFASLIPQSLVPAQDALAALGGWAAPILPTRARSRWFVVACAAGVGALFAAWIAVRQVPWFGPLVADNLRRLLGAENVTLLEETLANVEDRVQHVVDHGQARGLSDSTPPELLASTATLPVKVLRSDLAPRDVGALNPAVSSADDGVWQPVAVRGSEASVLYRTIVHPDAERVYAELFVFALDLSQVELHAVAGSVEPKSPEPKVVARPGVVPADDRPRLIAAFNGGFKAEHGQFGMMVDGTELLAPRSTSCTFAALADGSLRVASWPALASEQSKLSWWRQTPGCMLEDGVLNPALRGMDSRNWGATLDGKTVIRRSAVGLSKDGHTLFVGISKSTTARALALGMQHAGAVDVAQLDVNFSFPRFLLYRDAEQAGELTAIGAVSDLLYAHDEYLGRASTRDFFYVTLR